MFIGSSKYPFLARERRPEGLPPKIKRNPKVKLGASEEIVFEASVASSLGVMILLFLFFPHFQPPKKVLVVKQETITFEEVERTQQENRPPPPPRPPIPIEAPGDEALDDIEIGSTELDVTAEVAPPAPQISEDDDASYFVAVEDMPQIVGGYGALTKRVEYPDLAKRAGVAGRVYVLAYVNEKGEVVKAEVQKGIGGGCDEAAVKAVMATKFIPGKQRGKPVRVRISIPIVFQLDSGRLGGSSY
jgi:protein TonB